MLAAATSGEVIDFAPAVRTIDLTSGIGLVISTDVTIQNDQGAGPVTIDGGGTTPIFGVHSATVTVSLSGLILSDGGMGSFGGGIANYEGTLTISDCTFLDNSSNNGGGIGNSAGTVTVSDCTFIGNSGAVAGGAIANAGGTLTVSDCTFSDNTTSNIGAGGAISNGGFFGSNGLLIGTATVNDCTLSGNSASVGGGIFGGANGTLTVNGNIIVGNTNLNGGADDFDNAFGTLGSSSSYNVVGSDDQSSLPAGQGNQVNVTVAQAGLFPLGNYGGQTETFALFPDSIAIGNGRPEANGATDQRGAPRPETGGDAGAFEEQGYSLTPTNATQSAPVDTAFALPLQVTLTEDFTDTPLPGATINYVAPGSGASAALTSPAVTNAEGQTSVTATANSTAGSYDVTASAGPGVTATFLLTNTSTGTAPTVIDPTDTSITQTTATLGGDVTDGGSAPIISRGVVVSLTSTNPDPVIGGIGVADLTTGGTTGVFTIDATGLTPGATYSFAAYAINSVGTTYTSPATTFTTPVLATAPTVADPTDGSVTGTTAILGGDVTSDGGAPITARGVVFSLTSVNPNPRIGGTGVTNVTTNGATGVFTIGVGGLTPGATYSFAAYATNSVGTTYAISSFTTLTTVQFVTGAETVNQSAGTFSIPVTLTGTPDVPLTVTTIAPFGTFFFPAALAADAAGNVYVADMDGTVDQITPAGAVSQFASGFNDPTGLAIDADGNLYVADHSTVDEVTPAGVVTPVEPGFTFDYPNALAIDAAGNLFVSDAGNGALLELRRQASGSFAMPLLYSSGFDGPDALAVDAAGNVYVANGGNNTVDKVSPAGVVSTFASGFEDPNGLAFDAAGNLYVSNYGNLMSVQPLGSVDKVTPAGVVSTFLGPPGDDQYTGLTFDPAGNLYVNEYEAGTVTKVSQSVTVPFTLGGSAVAGKDYSGVSTLSFGIGQTSTNITGNLLLDPGPAKTLVVTLGTPTGASLGSPSVNTLTIDEATPVKVQFVTGAETVNQSADTFSIPVTLTGTPNVPQTVTSIAPNGTFDFPSALAADAAGNVYVANMDGTVDQVTPAGAVSQFASGFGFAIGLAVDAAGNLYVANGNTVDEVSPDGTVSPVDSGFTFDGANALAFDAAGNLYVSNAGAGTLLKLPRQASGSFAMPLLYASGLTGAPDALTVDAAGNVYVANGGNNTVDEVSHTGAVTLFASGFEDPNGLAFDAAGNLYVSNYGNPASSQPLGSVDKVTPAGVVSTFLGPPGDDQYTGLTFDPAGNLYVNEYEAGTVIKVSQSVTVPFTLGGSAVAGKDYSGVSTLSFGIGQTSTNITGNLLLDPGPAKTLVVTLGTPTGASLGSPSVNTLTIDEATPAKVQFVTGAETVNQSVGTFSIPVTLTGTPDVPQTVTSIAPNGTFSFPVALAADAAGNVYVAYVGNFQGGTVDQVTPAGGINQFASGLGLFSLGLAVDAAGNVYVANGNTVEEVSPDGTVSPVESGFTFNNPTALAFDAAGNLYVSDAGNGALLKLPRQASGSFGMPILYSSGFAGPDALAVDAAGNVYVANGGNNTVDEVSHTGAVTPFASGFEDPNGLAFDAAGNLYVSNYGNPASSQPLGSVDKVTPAGVVSTFLGPPGDDQYTGLTFDPAGNLYVNEYEAGTVIKVSQSVTVPFTLGGSAVAGKDYSGVSTLSFGIGQTSTNITGTLLPVPGPAKTLVVTLGTPTGASLGTPSVNTLTIDEPTSSVRIVRGGFRYSYFERLFTQSLTITNSSAQAIAAPLDLVLENLSSNATLTDASGTTGTGPYITVLSTGTLAPGASVTIILEFHDSSASIPISYLTEVFQGVAPAAAPAEMTAASLLGDELTEIAIALLSNKRTFQ